MTLATLVGSIIGIINKILPVLISLGVVAFLWLCVRYVMSPGDEGGSRRSAIVWGLIGLFVMFSFWGLVGILCATFLPGGSCNGTASVPSSTSISGGTNGTDAQGCFMFNGKKVCN